MDVEKRPPKSGVEKVNNLFHFYEVQNNGEYPELPEEGRWIEINFYGTNKDAGRYTRAEFLNLALQGLDRVAEVLADKDIKGVFGDTTLLALSRKLGFATSKGSNIVHMVRDKFFEKPWDELKGK